MNGKARGMMLLTCPLGQPDKKPLTPAQYQNLSRRILSRGLEQGNVTVDYLKKIGYTTEDATRIFQLLEREERLEAYLSRGAQLGLDCFTRLDSQFPSVLRQRQGKDCTTTVFTYGNLELLSMEKIAVVGTRNPTPEQTAFAWDVGTAIAETGMALVSGGANGVDSVAAEACQKAGGYVITMVPDQLEKRLSLGNSHTLLWSNYGYDLPFTTKRAYERNNDIHSLSQRAVVIGPRLGTGGTWQGATENLKKQWNPVAVLDDQSPGARALAEQGAMLVQDWTNALFAKPAQMAFPL